MPKRVQLSRAKGWRMPPNTVKVDRSTRWGNPFLPRPGETAHGAVAAFQDWLAGNAWACAFDAPMERQRKTILDGISGLRGKNLACWCPLDAPCHADVLLEIANA